MIHGGIKHSTEAVKQFAEVSSIPRRGLNNSQGYEIFHAGGVNNSQRSQTFHGGVKYSLRGV